MVVQKIMLSPCVICENEELYNLSQLSDTLDFIDMYLECGLDTMEGSVFHESSWFLPPVYKQTTYHFFITAILPKLQQLLRRGNAYSKEDLGAHRNWVVRNSDFNITNESEMDLLARYTVNVNKDYILFVGKTNYGLRNDTVDLEIDGEIMKIPVVREPYTEKSNCFDSFIKQTGSKDIFVNASLCVKLDSEMKEQAKAISGSKGSLYKKYGEVVAQRNEFSPYIPSNPYNTDTKYFIRKDKKYVVSIDLLHGHFEVF